MWTHLIWFRTPHWHRKLEKETPSRNSFKKLIGNGENVHLEHDVEANKWEGMDESLYYASAYEPDKTRVDYCKDADKAWYDEIDQYSFIKNTDKNPKDDKAVGNFTQMLWRHASKHRFDLQLLFDVICQSLFRITNDTRKCTGLNLIWIVHESDFLVIDDERLMTANTGRRHIGSYANCLDRKDAGKYAEALVKHRQMRDPQADAGSTTPSTNQASAR